MLEWMDCHLAMSEARYRSDQRQSSLSASYGQLGEGGFQGVGVRARGKRVPPSTCDVATNPFAGEFHDDCQTTL